MSLNTISDITTEVLVRSQQNTTSGHITDTMLNDWLTEKHRWAASFKKWPFTEGRVSTTFASLATDEDGNSRGEFPEGWKPESIRQMKIDGKWVQKTGFQAWHRWREKTPDENGEGSRLFADYGRLYFLSPNIDISGTIVLWGQYTPTDIDVTDNTALTIFSNVDEDGNEAIVEAMVSELLTRSDNSQGAQQHLSKAVALLSGLWDKITQEQPNYHNDDTSMFSHFDVLAGGMPDDLARPRRWY